MNGWIEPVPGGTRSRGFGPSAFGVDGPYYADNNRGIAHDINPAGPPGNGDFPGAVRFEHFHPALDVAAPIGTPILAPQSGLVLDAWFGFPGSWADGGGWYFRVLVNDGCMYLGAHCSKLLVEPGQAIRQGQHIANVGQTGVATGPHLHLWVRLGERTYYDGYYWNPEFVLPGGVFHGDARFAPDAPPVPELPDTGLPGGSGVLLQMTTDRAPLRYRSELGPNGQAKTRTLLANKPIRKGTSVHSDTWRTFKRRREIQVIGRIPKSWLPAAERQFGDVLITPVYMGNGHYHGCVKQVDLAGN